MKNILHLAAYAAQCNLCILLRKAKLTPAKRQLIGKVVDLLLEF